MSLRQTISTLTAGEIDNLIAASMRDGDDQTKSGYQGSVHVVRVDGARVVIKSVTPSRSPLGWLRRRMLSNEYKAYQKLEGLPGVPECFGLVEGKYLILDCIDGKDFRELPTTQDEVIHARLLALIKSVHERGVAHADLKRRDNLMLGADGKPYLIDFGMAVIRKDGFRPVNHYLFRFARQLDYHGWIKNKYRYQPGPTEGPDLEYFKPTRIERAARWVRRTFRKQLDAIRRKLALR